jgi:hypothetical protein
MNGTVILSHAREGRDALVRRMADDLIECDAYANKLDACRCLLAKRYDSVDVAILLDDARQVAMQDVVAREMTGS